MSIWLLNAQMFGKNIGVGTGGAAGAFTPPTTQSGGREYLFAPPQLFAMELTSILKFMQMFTGNSIICDQITL